MEVLSEELEGEEEEEGEADEEEDEHMSDGSLSSCCSDGDSCLPNEDDEG